MKRFKDMLNDEMVQAAILIAAIVAAVGVPLSPIF